MLKPALLSLAVTASLLFAASSSANESTLYLNGHVGQAQIEEGPFVRYRDDTDTSLGVRLGWNLRPWLSIEAGYNRFGDFRSTCCGAGPFQTLDYDSFELGLRGRVPFGDSGWYGVARAGVHQWDDGFPGRGSRRDPHYGVGVAYQINDRFAVGADYDRYQTDNALRDVDRTGVSVEVSF